MRFRKLLILPVLTAMILGTLPTVDVRAGSDIENTQIPVAEAGVIPGGVTIGGSNVSGMNAFQAEAALHEMLKMYDDTKFTLMMGEGSIEATGADIHIMPLNTDIIDSAINYGKRGNLIERFMAKSDLDSGKGKNFDLSLTCDWAATKEFLEGNVSSLASAPVDHKLVREGGAFRVIEGKSGIGVDTTASASIITEYITSEWDGGDGVITLATQMQEPKGSVEDLLQVKDLLGSYSTDFSSSSNARAANVKNGASRLNTSVIYPGESFSVSTGLGSRNAENGYHLAASYENGTTVDTYGGGVCQISTTLYNAVIRAELEIVERSPHSMVVAYVKPSMDAAISEGAKDFVFRNDKNYPVYIEGYTNGGMLYFNIYGKEERPSGRKVSFESEVLTTTDPPNKYVADSTLPVGRVSRTQSAHTGYTARLWKVVTVDGQEQSRTVFNNSSYRASSAIYSVGTASDNPEAVAAINAAISSQDKDTIDAAASAWSGAGSAGGTAAQAGSESTGAGDSDEGDTDSSTPDSPDIPEPPYYPPSDEGPPEEGIEE